MNKQMLEACKALAKIISEDEKMKRYHKAEDAYNSDHEIKNLMAEYNVQQIALAEEYKKEQIDTEFIGIINKRIEELYKEISEKPVMTELMEAQEDVNALMNEVNSEIQFFITGSRPCSHDCSSCASKCSEQK
jgi:cell fate (sporulation/competence/biofilm development) regulator YmcA (YheA/YmcA/DUF963 family)